MKLLKFFMGLSLVWHCLGNPNQPYETHEDKIHHFTDADVIYACAPEDINCRKEMNKNLIALDEYEKLVKYENNGANDETKELIQDQVKFSGSSDESEQGKRSRKNPPEEFEILDGDDVPLVEEVVEGMLDDKSNGLLEVNGDNFMTTVMKMNKAQELTSGEAEHEHEGDFVQIKEEANDSVESIPAAPEVIDVEDSGDSESDSDEESEEHDAAPEILLNEANAQNYAIFEALPPEQKEEAKRQFPDFWRTYQAVRKNTGLAYEQEDDPDFTVENIENAEDADVSSDSSDDEADKPDAKTRDHPWYFYLL